MWFFSLCRVCVMFRGFCCFYVFFFAFVFWVCFWFGLLGVVFCFLVVGFDLGLGLIA